jgi:hypothetical protein
MNKPKIRAKLRVPALALFALLVGCNSSKPRESEEALVQASPKTPLPKLVEAPSAVAPEPALPVREVGEDGWVEVFSYRFRASRFERCPVSEGASNDTGGLRLGVLVHVKAKYDELLVAARDFTLQKGGVIVSSEIAPTRCGTAPLLRPTQLKSGQIASGLVVFQVPEAAFVPSATLVYQATRWGGAPRATLAIPQCWPSCSGPTLAAGGRR